MPQLDEIADVLRGSAAPTPACFAVRTGARNAGWGWDGAKYKHIGSAILKSELLDKALSTPIAAGRVYRLSAKRFGLMREIALPPPPRGALANAVPVIVPPNFLAIGDLLELRDPLQSTDRLHYLRVNKSLDGVWKCLPATMQPRRGQVVLTCEPAPILQNNPLTLTARDLHGCTRPSAYRSAACGRTRASSRASA
jgi:hypothetical protein